jgi:hypothetical protein
MNATEQAEEFRKGFLEKNPNLKEEVDDMFQLMQDEIEQGESPQNELDLFIGACEDLLIEED